MSSNLAYARPTVRPAHRPAEAPVRSVRPVPRRTEVAATRDQRRARPKAAYSIITVSSLFLIFAAQLLLSLADFSIVEIDPSLRMADIDRKNNKLEIKW